MGQSIVRIPFVKQSSYVTNCYFCDVGHICVGSTDHIVCHEPKYVIRVSKFIFLYMLLLYIFSSLLINDVLSFKTFFLHKLYR